MRLAVCCVWPTIAVLAAGEAHGRTDLLKTRAGSPVHWTRAEITLGLDAAAVSRSVHRMDVVHAVQRAAHAWNRIPASQPRLRFTTDPERDVTLRFCRGKWQGDAVDLGRTQFDASPADGTVTSAKIELNECDHRFTPPGERASGPYDLQSVLTHELGHVLGIGHSDAATAIMYPNGNGVLARFPGPDDETALAVLYVGRALQPNPASRAQQVADVAVPQVTPQAGATDLLQTPEASPTTGKRPPDVPAGSTPVLNVQAGNGREVLIYAGEPTLLPPLVEAPKVASSRRSRRTEKRP